MIQQGDYDEDDLPPKPEVDPLLQWVWKTWHRLTSDRAWIPVGMGPPVPSRIPWAVLRDWSEFHNLSVDEFIYLDRLIWEMDAVFITDFKQKSTSGAKTEPQSSEDKIARWEATPNADDAS